MNRKQRRPESRRDSVAAPCDAPKGDATPMENFKTLTRRLLNVTRSDVQEQQDRFDIENAARRKGRVREGK
jgi:hypothetical protein